MTSPSLQRDAVYGLLGHRIRRAIVVTARAQDVPTPLSEMTSAVANAIAEQTQTATPDGPMRLSRLEVQLHHTHLPKLEMAGVLTYDADAQLVTEFDADELELLSQASDTLEAEFGGATAAE
ncbi:hypothetical protein SAMN04488124_1689 [Halogeometricum limi]|uniref:DUF7344 domain-containing protein n=2 Tax=Halogeometricum limi TaxID=555875 RepID=A0A1I6GYA9_9EURY|nr:hypothetical protein SAMN04488124_1689 [Halogeometricum limi]